MYPSPISSRFSSKAPRKLLETPLFGPQFLKPPFHLFKDLLITVPFPFSPIEE